MAIFDHPSSISRFPVFSPNPFPLCHLQKITNYRRKGFCINECLSMSHIKRNRKDQKVKFMIQLMLPFSHIDAHVLTSHVDKVVKLLFCEADDTAVSEAISKCSCSIQRRLKHLNQQPCPKSGLTVLCFQQYKKNDQSRLFYLLQPT